MNSNIPVVSGNANKGLTSAASGQYAVFQFLTHLLMLALYKSMKAITRPVSRIFAVREHSTATLAGCIHLCVCSAYSLLRTVSLPSADFHPAIHVGLFLAWQELLPAASIPAAAAAAMHRLVEQPCASQLSSDAAGAEQFGRGPKTLARRHG